MQPQAGTNRSSLTVVTGRPVVTSTQHFSFPPDSCFTLDNASSRATHLENSSRTITGPEMQTSSKCDGLAGDAAMGVEGARPAKSLKVAIDNDDSGARLSGEHQSLGEFEIRPSLHLDLSFLTFTSTLGTSSAFSSLTPLSSPILRSASSLHHSNLLDSSALTNESSSSYFNTSPAPSAKIVRPGLKHSQFSSFCAEPIVNESAPPKDPVIIDSANDAPIQAQTGWSMAQRLRDAALSDWESQRTIKPAFLVSKPRPTSARSLSPGHNSSLIRAKATSRLDPRQPSPIRRPKQFELTELVTSYNTTS